MSANPDGLRLTSRIIILDDDDRVLLLFTRGVPAQPTRWLTPGGGVDAGESHHDAACRELYEETGHIADDLGDPVWSRDFVVDHEGEDHDRGHAEFYLLRTSAFAPSPANWTASELVDIEQHRWFTVDELRATDDPVDPPGLADVVARFVRETQPAAVTPSSPASPSTAPPLVAPPSAPPSTDRTSEIDRLIAEVEEQERTLLFSTFTNEDAWALGSSLVELARQRSLPVTIDITRGEQQLFHAAMPGTAAHNDVWIARKTRTVREFGTSSYLAGLRAKRGGNVFDDAPWIDPMKFAGHGGSFPVTVRDVGVVGTVTVSGLPQRDDHLLTVEAVRSFLRSRP